MSCFSMGSEQQRKEKLKGNAFRGQKRCTATEGEAGDRRMQALPCPGAAFQVSGSVATWIGSSFASGLLIAGFGRAVLQSFCDCRGILGIHRAATPPCSPAPACIPSKAFSLGCLSFCSDPGEAFLVQGPWSTCCFPWEVISPCSKETESQRCDAGLVEVLSACQLFESGCCWSNS